MQNIEGVACRRSEVANVTVAAIEQCRALCKCNYQVV